MREQLEAQLTFARQRQEEAKYIEHHVWKGYIQGLEFALSLVPRVLPADSENSQIGTKQIRHD